MAQLPWMPLYVADYLADTGHLSTLEHGVYLLLIMHYWQHGSLPKGDNQLARIARMPLAEWQGVRDTLAALFGEGWTHGRIEKELIEASDLVSKRSAAGKAGAYARYSKRIANAKQTNAPTPTPTPEPIPNTSLRSVARESARSKMPEDWPSEKDQQNAIAYWSERGRPDLVSALKDQVERARAHHLGKGTKSPNWSQVWVTWYSNAPGFTRAPSQNQQSDWKPLKVVGE